MDVILWRRRGRRVGPPQRRQLAAEPALHVVVLALAPALGHEGLAHVAPQRGGGAKDDEDEQARRDARHEEDPVGAGALGRQVGLGGGQVRVGVGDGHDLEQGVGDLEDAERHEADGEAEHQPAVPDALPLPAGRVAGHGRGGAGLGVARGRPVGAVECGFDPRAGAGAVRAGVAVFSPVEELAFRVDVSGKDEQHEHAAE